MVPSEVGTINNKLDNLTMAELIKGSSCKLQKAYGRFLPAKQIDRSSILAE